ncbi:MAG: DHA2 family efflux MFS transporter permease subunit [Hyphomicrobiales bacterium]|nr:MAG: DHA2 family efflux MFS transporter permease subunit [Hyphomicrobiales bacterium]
MTSETFDAAPAATAPADPSLAARNKLVIYILLASTFVVMLNETAMSVAIPPLMEALGVTASAAQWLTTAFLLTMAVVIPITGFLMQRLNSRPIFILAMTLFSIGTAVAAVSPGLPLLIVGRVIQAAGTAIMMPLLMTTIMTLVPPDERGKMMGNISIVMAVAPAIGPSAAGLILHYLEWRWIFIIVLPISLGALYLGYRMMVNVTTPRYAPLDIVSVILSVFGFGGIVYSLSSFGEAAEHAVISPFIPLGIGIVAMAIFIWRQIMLARKDAALLDLRTLKSRNYAISMVMLSILMIAMFGTIILLPIYLVRIQGFDTLSTGLLMLPGSLLMGLLGPFVGRLFDKVGPTPLVIPAMVLVTLVLWATTLLGVGTPWQFILAGHIVISIGFAFLFGPLFTSSLGSLPPSLYSHGSALLGSIQQVAGAAGVALFVAIMSVTSASLATGGVKQTEALAAGIRTAFTVGASIAVLALIASFFVRRPPAQEGNWGGGH